jgi:hypothetical protein
MKSHNSKTITIKQLNSKQKILDEVYNLLESTYKNVEGGLNFSDKYDLLENTSVWKVIYSNNNIIGVLIYKAKHGLKMVACAINKTYKNIAKKRLTNIFKKNFSKTWMEISEGLEKFILNISTAKKFIIDNTKANDILNKSIQLCNDQLHYIRQINGVNKTKILVGTPNLQMIKG